MKIGTLATQTKLIGALLILLSMTGCSAGDWRAFDDALYAHGGGDPTYENYTDVEYYGDIKWTAGVKNNSAFQILENTGYEYYKVKITFEDGTTRTFNLEPGESTGRMTVSKYNLWDAIQYRSDTTGDVFKERWD